jgi:transposase-like protein
MRAGDARPIRFDQARAHGGTLVAQGLSNRRIAEQLDIAVSTVQRHLANILTKVGPQSRVQLALWWVGQHPEAPSADLR